MRDAFRRILAADVIAHVVVVDPKDAQAEAFYRRYRFRPLSGLGRLILPLSEAERLLAER